MITYVVTYIVNGYEMEVRTTDTDALSSILKAIQSDFGPVIETILEV